MKAKVAQRGPYKVTLEKGKRYNWCTCGLSKNQPFCDGSHTGTSFAPMPFEAEKSGDAFLCGCKATKNPPYCDGEHQNLPEE